MAFLTVNSLIFTSFFNNEDSSEKIFIRFSLWEGLALLLFGLFCLYAFCRFKKNYQTIKIEIVLVIYTLIAGFAWLYISKAGLNGEGANIAIGASILFKGDYFPLAIDQYYGTFPFQLGYSLFCELVYLIFGNENFGAIMGLNVVFAACIQFLMIKIGKKTEVFAIGALNEKSVYLLAVLLFLFTPLIVGVTFTYGIIPGTAFSLLAVLMAIQFGQTGKIRYAAAAVLAMTAAVILKNNFLIIAIAVFIYLFVYAFKSKKTAAFICLPIFLISVFYAPTAVIKFYEWRAGGKYDLSQTTPKSAWIAMGLSDTVTNQPGWFNGYTYFARREVGYDTAAADNNAKKLIAERLNVLMRYPMYLADFMYRKASCQWNEPSYSTFLLNYEAAKQKDRTAFGRAIYQAGIVNTVIAVQQKWVQILTYAGVLLFLLTGIRKRNLAQLMPVMIMLGGFVFHQVWEAKSQYIFQYGLIGLISAAPGLVLAGEKMKSLFNRALPDGRQVPQTPQKTGFSEAVQ